MLHDADKECLFVVIGNSDSSLDGVINKFSAKGSATNGDLHFVVMRFKTGEAHPFSLMIDGNEMVVDAPYPTPDPGDPYSAIFFGYGVGIEIADLGVYSRYLSASEVASLNDYATQYYGADVAVDSPYINTFFDGNSLNVIGTVYPFDVQPAGVTMRMQGRGLASQTTTQMLARSILHTDPFLDPNAAHNIAVGWELINEVAGGATAEEAYATYQAWGQARKAAGFQVVAVTCQPAGGVNNTVRADLNALIVAGYATFADALYQIHLDPDIGVDGANLDTTFYDPDTVHMTNAGYAIVCAGVEAAIETLL